MNVNSTPSTSGSMEHTPCSKMEQQGGSPRLVLGFVPSCPILVMLSSSDSSTSSRVEKIQTSTLASQRSLLSELLTTMDCTDCYDDTYSDADGDSFSDAGDVGEEHLRGAAPCHCGVGLNYKAQLHAKHCPVARLKPAAPSNIRRSASTTDPCGSPQSCPIAIPLRTYYKNPAFIEERTRLQHQRQVYRVQLEQHERAIAAQQQRATAPQLAHEQPQQA